MRLLSDFLLWPFRWLIIWWKARRKWIKRLLLVIIAAWAWPAIQWQSVYEIYNQVHDALILPERSAVAGIETTSFDFEKMPQDIKDAFVYYHNVFGVKLDLKTIVATMWCEGQNNPEAKGDYSQPLLSIGPMQYQPFTFYQDARAYGVKNPDIHDWRDQVLIGMQAIRDGKIGQWSCYSKGLYKQYLK